MAATSKLEREMNRREVAEKSSLEARRKAEESREKRAKRQRRVHERREFNRLFSRLKKMVKGRWDRYGGWCFTYKDAKYYIAFEEWFSAKTPGDADDYDMSGTHWVLKRGHNALDAHTYTLAHEAEPKHALTESVLRGLKELNAPNRSARY